ncbi:dihydrolipoyllysine-residue acetyltransferase [Simplicispira suum]|uniref:Acetyltransferase component of pyruvate dehydrogenase complex n=1 Tax=Simplicispira suum TaxID=2109915 RepID=A0A2S0N3M5_9BURK|nr:dihydrolipoyllysine-residue acetyltransferase [Simplicispira suum]AVO42561.1 dihydrolipoyllysine-residue acetyltransferase [Simplicispira suum]
MKTIEICAVAPDPAQKLEVLEILVRAGQVVQTGALLATVETPQEAIELRSPEAGRVSEVLAEVGAELESGELLLRLEVAAQQVSNSVTVVTLPDVGDARDLVVTELLVAVGDTVKEEQSLITVESDKASMEIPSSASGVVKELKVKLGDKVNVGDLIAVLEGAVAPSASAPAAAAAPVAAPVPAPAAAPAPVQAAPASEPAHQPAQSAVGLPHASPSVRKAARELGVPLGEVKGSGPKGRITLEDVQSFTRAVMAGTAQTQAQAGRGAGSGSGVGLDLLPWPKVDFAKFGAVEAKPLSRIKKISGANLARNWVMIPHVTNNDEADVTDLEAFRVQTNKEGEKAKSGVKVTMLAFVIKAVVAALKKFPEFNTSLDGENLVYKHYYHIGFAADTPNGLMVPVLRDADQKGILQISQEMSELARKAREGKLGSADMQGGCFSISSLGGIGGTHFTPIINAPEVAILGLSKSAMKPVWDGKVFVPRLILPLSLSYDHRVIDGAAAARFNAYLGQVLADYRRILL